MYGVNMERMGDYIASEYERQMVNKLRDLAAQYANDVRNIHREYAGRDIELSTLDEIVTMLNNDFNEETYEKCSQEIFDELSDFDV